MKRAFVDATVILRYLTRDRPEMAEAALRTDPETWKTEQAEREAWDMTLADGLEQE